MSMTGPVTFQSSPCLLPLTAEDTSVGLGGDSFGPGLNHPTRLSFPLSANINSDCRPCLHPPHQPNSAAALKTTE